jgi:hypothetical protein
MSIARNRPSSAIRASSTLRRSHDFGQPRGSPVSRCHDEFAGTINHNATGEIEWHGEAHRAPGCTVTNCAELAEQHWPILGGHEEAGREFVIVEFCLRGGGVQLDIHCTAEMPTTHTAITTTPCR